MGLELNCKAPERQLRPRECVGVDEIGSEISVKDLVSIVHVPQKWHREEVMKSTSIICGNGQWAAVVVVGKWNRKGGEVFRTKKIISHLRDPQLDEGRSSDHTHDTRFFEQSRHHQDIDALRNLHPKSCCIALAL